MSEQSSLSHRARQFALEAHGDQKYGDKPYRVHLDAVAALVAVALPDDDEAKAAAYLHDTAEDTAKSIADVEAEFGPVVANAVSLVTDEPGKNRRERKAATHAKLGKAHISMREGRVALVVKLSDRVSNVRACVMGANDGLLKMYRKEHKAFRDAVHRDGFDEDLWVLLETMLKD